MSSVVSHLLCITVILVHTLCHDPGAQPEPQDEVFTRRDAVDLMLNTYQLGEERPLRFIELLVELSSHRAA